MSHTELRVQRCTRGTCLPADELPLPLLLPLPLPLTPD